MPKIINRFKYLEKSLSQNKDTSHTKSDHDSNIKPRNTHKKSNVHSSSSSLNTSIDWSVNAKVGVSGLNNVNTCVNYYYYY